jgi:hypothetical protein
MPAKTDPRYEVIQGFNDDVFAELWDKSLAPAGLAFLLRQSPEGLITLTGFDVEVPVEVFSSSLATHCPTWCKTRISSRRAGLKGRLTTKA